MKRIVDKLFKDKSGKIVIWQNPNIPLWVWILSMAINFVIKSGPVYNSFSNLGTAALFTWAYLEIRSGANIFRRVIGIIVMLFVIFGLFKSAIQPVAR